MSEREVVLYRCPTPTDVLCPCGAVSRRLRKKIEQMSNDERQELAGRVVTAKTRAELDL